MKLYDRVKKLLEDYPKLRDSDRLLIWNVWGMEGLVHDGVITKENFLKAPHTESIRRVRQKIQEQHPNLQSSPEVQKAKKTKEKKKGNFVYKEEVKEKPKGHYEQIPGTNTMRWVSDE